MGLFVRKMDKAENLEYWLAKFDLNLSIIIYKMSCDNPKLGIVNNNMYAKYDPNLSILSQLLSGNNFGH